MSEHAIPVEDATVGERLLRLLDRDGPAPGAALWWWVEQAEQWRYVVAGDEFAVGDPEVAGRIEEALVELGSPFGADRVDVLAVDDQLLGALGRKVQVSGVSRVRLGAGSVDGIALPACLVYRLALQQGQARRRPPGDDDAEARLARRQARRQSARAKRDQARQRRRPRR